MTSRSGTLRVYLGAAPGVGKTFAMLDEGWRRKERGTDVVVGYVETHGRAKTAAQLRDLEIAPRAQLTYRGSRFEEMDVAAILARRPAVVLVDELAHTNVPGSERPKRWLDIEVLLDAGIDVISTLNIQHIESVNDVVARITGIEQRETVPDAFVRRADQIELVDMSPEALRRRMAHGNIYQAEKVDAALANYFRVGNLAALREIALLWVADRVEDALQSYMDANDIDHSWETRERVVVALTGAAGQDQVIRRAARMANRRANDLLGVFVTPSDGLATSTGAELDTQRRLLEELGGSYHELVSDDVPAALVGFARTERATQLVLGASHRSRLAELLRGSVVADVIRASGEIDVHVISRGEGTVSRSPGRLRLPRLASGVSRRRQAAGMLLAAIGLPLVTAALAAWRDQLSLATDLLVYLCWVVLVAAVGGVLVGLAAAVAAFGLANWYFIEPHHTLTVADTENLVALIIFLAVAATVASLVSVAARRSAEALRSRREIDALARSTASLIGAADPLPGVLDHLRITLGAEHARLETRSNTTWQPLATAGQAPPGDVSPSTNLELDREHRLVLYGPPLNADDRRLASAFTGQLATAVRTRQLQEEASAAAELEAADELRTGLLRAVSHDLRTPLATIKASASSLLSSDVTWDDEQRRLFLEAIDQETDRLDRLVGNLLDMSRLQAGALVIVPHAVGLEDVAAGAVASLGDAPVGRVTIDLSPSLPTVLAEPALLERAVANLVGNALNATVADPVRIEGGAIGHQFVDLRVIDNGPGIPPHLRHGVFAPFQRLDDRGGSGGIGLGLAIARGFVEAMGGELTLDDTPGGGLTATVRLPQATNEQG